jgi:hypothetical protein
MHPRQALACLALLVPVLSVPAAPAPEPGREAKQKLEGLKKRLPDAVAAWAHERWAGSSRVEVRIVRLLGPAEAKLTLVSLAANTQGGREPEHDEVITVFLRYYDGAWSATRFEVSWPASDNESNKAVRFLMLAIDEAGSK